MLCAFRGVFSLQDPGQVVVLRQRFHVLPVSLGLKPGPPEVPADPAGQADNPEKDLRSNKGIFGYLKDKLYTTSRGLFRPYAAGVGSSGSFEAIKFETNNPIGLAFF